MMQPNKFDNRLKNSKSLKDNLNDFNMDDFKGKILGAIDSANKVVEDAKLTRSLEK